MLIKLEALDAFKKYWETDYKSALSSKDTTVIVKFILSLLAPNEMMSFAIQDQRESPDLNNMC